MDYGAAFTFVTQDEDWLKKIVIGALLVLTGIGAIVVMGWSIEVLRRAVREDHELLPDWSNFGRYVIDGLKVAVIGFLWFLPLFVLIGCLVGAGVAASDQMASADDAAVLILALNACAGLLALIYGVLVAFLFPAAAGILADTEGLGQALNPANAFRLVRANPAGYILAWLLGSIAMAVVPAIGSIACGIGALPATAYAYAVQGHLWGQAYRQAQAGITPAI